MTCEEMQRLYSSVYFYNFLYRYKSFSTKASYFSIIGSGPIYISNMTCYGTESHINECSYEISNHCTHYDDVTVECTGTVWMFKGTYIQSREYMFVFKICKLLLFYNVSLKRWVLFSCSTAEERSTECETIYHKRSKMYTMREFEFIQNTKWL
jgi:hypothetical protein